MDILFIVTGILCVFSYFIYPVVLKCIPERKKITISSEKQRRLSVSLIITAHNEEKRIREKLINTLAIDYPEELLEVIVASDFSTDQTDEIVLSYASKGVRLVRADERKGKEYAQLCAIKQARGDILVFSDVATKIEPNAFHLLVEHFDDPKVGAVSSEDRFISQDGNIVGEGAYVKYEMWLRALESSRAGLVGLSGSFFAAKREVCDEWDIRSPSDFNTALNCAKKGLVAVSSPSVIGIYSDVKDPSLEYQRKIRTIIRGITAISRHVEVLNPFKFGLFAFQVWSHKMLRWAVPWFLISFFIITLLLCSDHWFYMLTLILQILFYGCVLFGHLLPKLRNNTLVKIPYFFVQVNLAIAVATLKFLTGKRMTTWSPSQR